MADNFYITTTLPYVNAEPHIGFALEIIAADVITRHRKMLGNQVVFNTGTDEHGQKIYQNSIEEGLDPQSYTDKYAAKFEELKNLLNLNYTHFIRTTNPEHINAAQQFWQLCAENGDIYKDNYQILYCVGCELEKQASDLVDGRCPLHPHQELEERNEENYYFRFSKYQQPLLEFYKANPNFVKPESKMKEIVAFVEGGLQDFSISRLKEKMPWGVSVPGDDQHVMYVWFDALINYISTLGWPSDKEFFKQFWPGVQIAGKDNLRQQAAMWQAMLMSADLPNSQNILINGFISVEGQKMSKSLGNVISPKEMVDKYGTDGTRYLLMLIGPISTDMDVSWDQFDIAFNAFLSNGVGNVCSRIAKLCEKAEIEFDDGVESWLVPTNKDLLANYEIKSYVEWINEQVSMIDQKLSELKPWEKSGTEQSDILKSGVKTLVELGKSLVPIIPEVGQKISTHFSQAKITALKPLFPRV